MTESNGSVAVPATTPKFTSKTYSHLKGYQTLSSVYAFITSLSVFTYLSTQIDAAYSKLSGSKLYKNVESSVPPVPAPVVSVANATDEIADSLLVTFDGFVSKLAPYSPFALYSKASSLFATKVVVPTNTLIATKADSLIGGEAITSSTEYKETPDKLSTTGFIVVSVAKKLRLSLWTTSATLSSQVHETYASESEKVTKGSPIQKNITASYNTANILAKDLNSKFIQPSLEQTKGLVSGVASSTKHKADTLIQDAKSSIAKNDFVVKVTSVAGSAVDTIANATKPVTDAAANAAATVGEATKPVVAPVAEVISPVLELKPPVFTASA